MSKLKMSERIDTRVIQVTNIAPSCTNDQLRTLFSYLGRVKEQKVYPPENTEGTVARVAYIEFDETVTTGVALHLSSTVFIDRALMIVPVMDGKIPDENTALQLTPQAVAGMLPGQPTWPANVVSQVTGTGTNQVITTYDPRLTSLGLPQYPPLPITTDASKIEEIRRTVYVSDLDPKVTAEMLLSFFSQVGEIKYIRLAGDERAAARAAYIEFTDQRSVAQSLTYNNVVFQGRTISVQHSKTNIVKPSGKMNEASQREIDEAMKKVKEASKLISAAASEKKDSSHSPNRKRSRSKSKRRSRSPSASRRSRSRSKGRRRRSRSRTNKRSRSRHRTPRRSRTPVRRRRSRSRGRVIPSTSSVVRRSRSRERRRSRTRSPVRRRRSRTRSRTPKRRSRTPPRSYSKRSLSRTRRSRSRSKQRRSRSRDRKDKIKEKKKSVSLSPPRLERNGSIPPKDEDDDKELSPRKIDSSAGIGGEGTKAISKKRSPSPVKLRRRSPTPRKRSRSRSPSNRHKRRRRTRTPSPRKRSLSRSGSRHRSKRDRSKRSRSRDRKHESRKKPIREKDEKKKEPSSSKVRRDYDEEEKGFASGSDRIREDSEPRIREDSEPRIRDEDSDPRSSRSPPPLEPEDKDSDHQPVDMDMSD